MAFLHHLRLLLFLSIICISYVCAQVLVSIDCGSSESSYIDDNFISWTNDENYIKNGQSYTVQTSSSVSPVMSTLRAFPTRKKNCYAISEASKGDRVLVRASFFYGNYDGKSSPPSFDLQFDGNDWLTVETSSTQLVYEEVIYTLRGDGLSVCVAQTNPGQVPFISALEVRALDSTMYKQIDANYPLGLVRRVGYGAKDIIRYSDDSYDRIWNPATPGNGLTSVASDAILISTSGLDQPPSSVLQNAITPPSPTSSILLNLGFTSTVSQVPVYINMYFSEVTELDPTTQTRSFQVVMNNQSLLTDPVAPPYGSFQEVTASNFTVSANTTLALVPVRGSTLPPIINAMELLVIGSPLSDGTNAKDVQGLASLKDAFEVLQDWNGDPCLPAPYSWDWINCSSDPVPRVTALYLNSFGLTGLLPDFSSMDALQTIDLHSNSLSGPIPDFLGTLPNLKQLNLGSNEFSGSVPASITKKNNLNLVVTGNPNLCTSGISTCKVNSVNSPTQSAGDGGGGGGKKSSSSKLPVILGITIPIFVIIWAVVGVLVVLRQRSKKNSLAAANISGAPGPTVSQQASPSNPLIGKMGQSIFNEIKLNMDNNNNNNNNNNDNNNNNNGDSD